jgi:uncharacterized protein (TIGR02996 family)
MPRRKTAALRPEVLAFLADIKDHPDDDAPRLILADWLEEHGDSRGAFVRAQVRRARLAADDPAAQEMERSEKELLTAHRQEWLGVLAEKGIVAEFHRGMVRLAGPPRKLLTKRLASLHPLEAAAWVDDLHVTDVRPEAAARLVESPHWTHLDRLSLDCDWYYSDHITGLTPGVGPEGGRVLAGLPALARLWELDLAHNDIGPAGVTALAARTDLGRLRTLNLSCNNLRDEGASVLATSRSLNGLTRLLLHQNRMGPAGAAALAQWPGLATVTSLTLSSNYIGPPGARALTDSPFLARLTELRLGCEHGVAPSGFGPHEIGPEGARVLASAGNLNRLSRLDLNGNGLGLDGARALLAAPWMPTLTDLDLTNNDLGDAGVAALAESPAVRGLTRLELQFNAVGDQGARALAASVHLTGLKHLGFRANRHMTSQGVLTLRRSFGDRVQVELGW